MAATVEQVAQIGGFRLMAIRGDSNYPTGGYAIPVGQYGVVIQAGHSPGYVGQWDGDARKLKLVDSLTGQTEVNGGTDVSAVTVRVLTA